MKQQPVELCHVLVFVRESDSCGFGLSSLLQKRRSRDGAGNPKTGGQDPALSRSLCATVQQHGFSARPLCKILAVLLAVIFSPSAGPRRKRARKCWLLEESRDLLEDGPKPIPAPASCHKASFSADLRRPVSVHGHACARSKSGLWAW